MSSHHVVRENQEPAVVVWEPCPFDQVAPLLEWSPLVVVNEPALETALTWGVRIDAVITRNQSPVLFDQQEPFVVICTQGANLLHLVEFLAQRKVEAINLIGRENLMAQWADFQHRFSTIMLLTHDHRWTLVQHGKYEKWVPAGTSFGLYPPSTDVTCEGLGGLTSTRDGRVIFRADHPFWIGEKNRPDG